MSQKEVTIVGRNNTKVEVTGQKELLVRIGSMAALGMATEATLQLVLSAIQNGSEFEAKLVVDAADVTWLEVRTWNTSLGTWNTPQYYLPGSNTAGVPTGAINYINPSSYLATIASNTTGINLEVTQLLVKAVLDTIKADTALINSNVVLGNLTLNTIDAVLDAIKLDTANLDVALSTRATEATLALIKAKTDNLNVQLSTRATETTLLLVLSQLQAIANDTANLDTNLSSRATEATLNLVYGVLNTIKTDTSQINSTTTTTLTNLLKLTDPRTPTSVASTGVTNIPAFATEISIFNNGTGDATVNGVKCPAGVTRTFGFRNPTSAIIVCDGGGTEELIIDYMA